MEVSVEVAGYNSKVYYIVTQGAGFGDGVYRFPLTGNETVLDALSQINGLRPVSSTKVWIARPTDDPGCVQRLEVCWADITANAYSRTNYQVLPAIGFSLLRTTLLPSIPPSARLLPHLSKSWASRVSGRAWSPDSRARCSKAAATQTRPSSNRLPPTERA